MSLPAPAGPTVGSWYAPGIGGTPRFQPTERGAKETINPGKELTGCAALSGP